MNYIEELEFALGLKANKEFLEMQPGDVPVTESDCTLLEKYVSYKPNTTIRVGIKNFVEWYKEFYNIK